MRKYFFNQNCLSRPVSLRKKMKKEDTVIVVFPRGTLPRKGVTEIYRVAIGMFDTWMPGGFSPKYSLCSWYLHSALQGPGPWHRSVWWRGTSWGAAGTSDRSQSPWLSWTSPHPENRWDSNQCPWTIPCNPACTHSAKQDTQAKFTIYKQLIQNKPALSKTQMWWKNKSHKKKNVLV